MKVILGFLILGFSLLYAGEAVYAVAGGRLFKSTDYGESWVEIAQEIPEKSCITGTLVQGPPDYYVLYTASQAYGIYKSTDLGYSWVPINSGLPIPLPSPAYKIVVNPANTAEVFLICKSGPIYCSTNEGNSWNYFPPPDGYFYYPNVQFDIAKDGTLWLFCSKEAPIVLHALLKRHPEVQYGMSPRLLI